MGSYKAQDRTLTSAAALSQKGQEEGRLLEPEGQRVMHIWLPSFERQRAWSDSSWREEEKSCFSTLRSTAGPSPFGCNTGTSSKAEGRVEKGGEWTWKSKWKMSSTKKKAGRPEEWMQTQAIRRGNVSFLKQLLITVVVLTYICNSIHSLCYRDKT